MDTYNEYLEQAKLYHKNNPDKWEGSTLHGYVADIEKIIKTHKIDTILNYGSGKARFVPPHWYCRNYDPAVAGFEISPKAGADLVICVDVLEHIPENHIKNTLHIIFFLAKKFVFLTIACYPAKAILPNGKNAHYTVKPPEWWIEKLKHYKNYQVIFDVKINNERKREVVNG